MEGFEYPLISVVIPTFNRSDKIEEAIDSVLKQSYNNFELLIVDDHSTDKTKEVIKTYSDKRIQYLINKRSKGAQGARNTGVISAKGDYISFLDSDDKFLPEKLNILVKLIKSDLEIDLLYSSEISIESNGTERVIQRNQEEDYLNALVIKNCIGSFTNVTIRKDCIIQEGLLDETFPAKQDHEFWLRLALNNYNFKCISEPLIIMRAPDFDDQKRVYNRKNKINGMIMLVNKYYDLYRKFPNRYGVTLLVICKLMAKEKDLKCLYYLTKGIWYSNTYIIEYLFKKLKRRYLT